MGYRFANPEDVLSSLRAGINAGYEAERGFSPKDVVVGTPQHPDAKILIAEIAPEAAAAADEWTPLSDGLFGKQAGLAPASPGLQPKVAQPSTASPSF